MDYYLIYISTLSDSKFSPCCRPNYTINSKPILLLEILDCLFSYRPKDTISYKVKFTLQCLYSTALTP